MGMIRFPIALAVAALLSTTAHANIITVDADDIGKSYTVNYDGFADGSVIEGLTGQTVLTLTGVTDNSFTFDYKVANTSTDPIDTSRVSIFGFNTNPDIASATSTGVFNQTATNGNVPSGFGTVDLCFKGSGGPNCSGGGGAGLDIGESGTGTLTLNFSSIVDQLTLSDFFVRYQSISGGGAPGSAIGRGTTTSSTGSTGSTSSTGGTEVPAPAAFWLFALALAGLGIRAGRRASASA